MSTKNTYEIFVSVRVLVHQAQLVMHKILNYARSDLRECDANCHQDQPNSCQRAPDHRAAVHGGGGWEWVCSDT